MEGEFEAELAGLIDFMTNPVGRLTKGYLGLRPSSSDLVFIRALLNFTLKFGQGRRLSLPMGLNL